MPPLEEYRGKPATKSLPKRLGSYWPKNGRYGLLAIESAVGVQYVIVDLADQALERSRESCHLRHAEGLRWKMKEQVELWNERDKRYDRSQAPPSDRPATIPRVAREACPKTARKAA